MWQLAAEAAIQWRREMTAINRGRYGLLSGSAKEAFENTVETVKQEKAYWRNKFQIAKSSSTHRIIVQSDPLVADDIADAGLYGLPATLSLLYRNMWRIASEWVAQLEGVYAKLRTRRYGLPRCDQQSDCQRAVYAARLIDQDWRRRYVEMLSG